MLWVRTGKAFPIARSSLIRLETADRGRTETTPANTKRARTKPRVRGSTTGAVIREPAQPSLAVEAHRVDAQTKILYLHRFLHIS